MVCPYCGNGTKVTNSRHQARHNQVWRRRQCLACGAIFTTHEAIELESTLVVEVDNRTVPFLPDQLLNELMLDLKHRKDVYTSAREVLHTVISRLLALPGHATLTPSEISRETATVLKRFDRAAYLRYLADHPS